MKRKDVARSLMIGAIVLLPLILSALDPRPLCPVCRRFADKSPQACAAQLMLGGKHFKRLLACSLFCLHEALEGYKAQPELIMIVSYPTLEDDCVQWINVEQAEFLFDASGSEKLSHEPYIYAFPDEKTAKAAQGELGGELLEWPEVHKRCTELAAAWPPPEEPEEESDIPHRRH